MRKYLYLFVITAIALGNTACKHRTDTPTIDLVKDSVYMYAQEDYLWYDALPSADVFNPRGFTSSDDLSALQMEIDAFSQYKKNPLNNNLAYEYNTTYPGQSKYSFIDQGQTGQTLLGNNSGFGIALIYGPLSNTDLRLRYVNPGSPAATAGLHRGDLITAISGVSGLDGTNTSNVSAINAALAANSATITLQRGTLTYTRTITKAAYTLNPVMKDTVYNLSGGKKVGYIVLSTFTALSNVQAKLDAAFDNFVLKGVTDLIVDLRYNGGGYVETAEYLDNLIVPASKSGTTMYTTYYNNKLQADNYPLLANKFNITKGDFSQAKNTVKFAKKKNLSINSIVFIITERTASASELTINNLLPHMEVRLVGRTSYGKPVGFFGIPISGYTLYISEFETKNSATKGGYYTGMQPASTDYPGYISTDDVAHDFGDPTENLLARSLSYLNVGTYAVPGAQIYGVGPNTLSAQQQAAMNSNFDDKSIKMMVFDKNKFQPKRKF